MRRINARLLSCKLLPTWGYVRSALNVADEPSRQWKPTRRAWEIKFRLITGASLAQRKSSRAKLGPLTSHRVAPRTRNRFCQAYGRFVEVLFTLFLMLSCVDDFDLLLHTYVQHLWGEGDTRCWANDCIAGI